MLLPLGVGSVLGYFDPFHADPNGKRPSSYNGRQHQQHIQHPQSLGLMRCDAVDRFLRGSSLVCFRFLRPMPRQLIEIEAQSSINTHSRVVVDNS